MSHTGHRTYRRNRARLKRTATVCALCGQPIDPDLPPDHPMSFTADHRTPVSKGGTHTARNLQAAHRRCNIRQGNRQKLPGAPENLGRRW